MRLGFLTNYTPETAAFAEETGFTCLELMAAPDSSLNADKLTAKEFDKILKDLESKDIELSALGHYPNPLANDDAEAAEARRYLLKVIDLAAEMKVPVVATFAGRNESKTVRDNLPLFKEAYSPIMDHAEKRGIKIAIENCPMMNWFSMKGENIAFSPEIWAEMFDLVPSKNLGLEFDPSHCVWLGIDYVKAILDFGDRIFHVHAKDMEIRKDVLGRTGIFGFANEGQGLDAGWWRARAPGWGDVEWVAFMSALMDVGYKGNIDIEHEDPVFATERQALQQGFRTLSTLIPAA